MVFLLLQSLGPLLPGNVVELQLNLLPLAAGMQVCSYAPCSYEQMCRDEKYVNNKNTGNLEGQRSPFPTALLSFKVQ